MDEIKVRLSMEVPGATMLSSLDCEKMSKKDAYESNKLVIDVYDKKGRKKQETLHYKTRKSRPAKQNISITKESYEYMISPKDPPTAKVAKNWSKYSKKDRLEVHLKSIAEHFNAISWNYIILD